MSVETKRIVTSDFARAILLLVPLFFLPISVDPFNIPKQWIFILLLVGMATHFVLNLREHFNNTRRSQTIELLILFLVASLLLAAFLSSTTFVRALFGYPGRANGLLMYIGILLMLYMISRMTLDSRFDLDLLKTLYFLYLIFAAYCFVQFVGFDPISWNNPFNPVIGTLGNPNFSGAFLGIASIILLVHAFQENHIPKRIFLFACASILLLLALATGSTQAFLIFMVGLAIQSLIMINRRLGRFSFYGVVALSCIGASFLFVSLLGAGPLGALIGQYTLQLRVFEYWRVGILISMKYPLTGIGPDSYVEGFRLLKGREFVAQYGPTVTADSAHNVLINFLANHGWISFLLLLGIYSVISFRAIKILFANVQQRQSVRLVSFIWLLMGIQSLFSLEQIGLSVFQWCCGGLLLNSQFIGEELNQNRKKRAEGRLAQEEKVVAKRTSTRALSSEASIMAILLTLICSLSLMRQEVELRKVTLLQVDATTQPQAISQTLDKFNSFTFDEIRRTIFVADFLTRSNALQEAQEVLENAIEKDPDAYEAFEFSARIARFTGDYEKERILRKRILELDPTDYKNVFSLAEVERMLGDKIESNELLAQILRIPFDTGFNESASILKNS